MQHTQEFATRFWGKVRKSETCWHWGASLDGKGYGQVYSGTGRPDKRMLRAHRVAYELQVGSVPDGLDLDHKCGRRSCVNPDHLEPVTRAENLRRSSLVLATINAAKTHCKRGHPFNEGNTYVDAEGRRSCKKCRAMLARNFRAKHAVRAA